MWSSGSHKKPCLTVINACVRSLCINNRPDLISQRPKFSGIPPSAVFNLICRKARVLWDWQCHCAHSDTGHRQVSIITLSFHTPTFPCHSPVTAVTKPESGLFAEGTFALFLACRELGTRGAHLPKDRHSTRRTAVVWVLASLPLAYVPMHVHTHSQTPQGPLAAPQEAGSWTNLQQFYND